MFAIIRSNPRQPNVSMLDIAGRPLIARQVQWLRDIGCSQIAVELEPGAEAAAWLAQDALGRYVIIVTTNQPLEPEEIARRAGFSMSDKILVLGADILCNIAGIGDILSRVTDNDTVALRLSAPAPLFTPDIVVYLRCGESQTIREAACVGWGVSVQSEMIAMKLTTAILTDQIPSYDSAPKILIHGAERSPGVWVARGAWISPEAEILAPAFIGVGATIEAGASVGPSAVIGDGAVIEGGAVVLRSRVCANLVVGGRLRLRDVIAKPGGLIDITGKRSIRPIEDPLLLSSRERPKRRPNLAIGLLTLISMALLWLELQ